MALKLSQLAIFCALVEEGSIYAAAEKVYCVPSNITSRIKDLEQSLNVALFYREHRKLNITPEGRIFYFKAKAILEQTQQCQNLFRSPHAIGTLHIGGLNSLFHCYIQPQSMIFLQQQHQVQLNLHTGTSKDLIDKLIQAELDIIFIDHPIYRDHIQSLCIATEPYYLLSQAASLVELQHHSTAYTLFTSQSTNQHPTHLHAWLEQQLQYQRHCQLDSDSHVIDAVQQGLGFGIIPSTMITEATKHQLHCFAIPDLSQNIYMLWHNAHPSKLLQAFVHLYDIEKSS